MIGSVDVNQNEAGRVRKLSGFWVFHWSANQTVWEASEAVLRHDREAMTGSQKHWMTGAVMATNALVSQELKSIREELSVSRKQRAAVSAATVTAPATVPEPAAEAREEKELLDQIHEFADEIKTLFDEAEKSVSAHLIQHFR